MSTDRERGLAEVRGLAWLLDNSIPVPGTGGRRVGIDALIGLVPFAGDLVSGGLSLFIVWRGSRLGLPRIVVTRMLTNTVIDLAIGAIPFAGDAFDLWFKANTRNLELMQRHLERPDAPTRGSWAVLLAVLAAVVGAVAIVGWLVAWAIGALIGAA